MNRFFGKEFRPNVVDISLMFTSRFHIKISTSTCGLVFFLNFWRIALVHKIRGLFPFSIIIVSMWHRLKSILQFVNGCRQSSTFILKNIFDIKNQQLFGWRYSRILVLKKITFFHYLRESSWFFVVNIHFGYKQIIWNRPLKIWIVIGLSAKT